MREWNLIVSWTLVLLNDLRHFSFFERFLEALLPTELFFSKDSFSFLSSLLHFYCPSRWISFVVQPSMLVHGIRISVLPVYTVIILPFYKISFSTVNSSSQRDLSPSILAFLHSLLSPLFISFRFRYFVLQGKTISYYADERDNRPRRTIDLSHCIVRSEGTKKGGMYHIICVYLASEVHWTENHVFDHYEIAWSLIKYQQVMPGDRKSLNVAFVFAMAATLFEQFSVFSTSPPSAWSASHPLSSALFTSALGLQGLRSAESLLLRLSTESLVEKTLWVDMLEQVRWGQMPSMHITSQPSHFFICLFVCLLGFLIFLSRWLNTILGPRSCIDHLLIDIGIALKEVWIQRNVSMLWREEWVVYRDSVKWHAWHVKRLRYLPHFLLFITSCTARKMSSHSYGFPLLYSSSSFPPKACALGSVDHSVGGDGTGGGGGLRLGPLSMTWKDSNSNIQKLGDLRSGGGCMIILQWPTRALCSHRWYLRVWFHGDSDGAFATWIWALIVLPSTPIDHTECHVLYGLE